MSIQFKIPALLFYFFFGIAFIQFASCKKEPVQVTTPPPPPSVNKPPIANAGADQTITLPIDSTILNGGNSSDPDGNIVSYSWNKIYGPSSFHISKTDSVKTIINKLVHGLYQFELIIIDNGGLYSKDTIQIIVYPIPPPPPLPSNSSVWFWTRDLVYNLIYININNETKILNESWGGNGDPLCYPYGGSMDFDLPAGTYTYKTWRQGRDTITGSVTVQFGSCNSVEISY
ncbi:MAG: hypothetical protein ABR502_11625 [Chitinophagaceae bacterium]